MAAIATLAGKLPAVRFMVLNGFPDMTFVKGTIKSTKKSDNLKKNQNAVISICSDKELSDPCVEIQSGAAIHDDHAKKRISGTPCLNSISSPWIIRRGVS